MQLKQQYSLDLYERERAEQIRDALQLATVVASILLLVFILLDHKLFEPAVASFLLKLRLSYVALLLALRWVAQGEFPLRYPHLSGIALAVLMGGMIDLFILYTGQAESPYYAGNNIVLLGIAVLFPWRAIWSFVVSALLLGMYAASAWPTQAGQEPEFINAVTFLGSMAVVAVVSSHVSERLRWTEFENRCDRDKMAHAKDEFLASVSHDLRTPLNVVLGYSELLADEEFGPLNDAQHDTIQRIVTNARGQLTLVNDLLDLARIEQGKISLDIKSVRVGDLVQGLSDMMTVFLLDRPVVFVANVDASIVVRSDPERLKQILTNLLTNAAKFTDSGEIRLEAFEQQGTVTVQVADTGHGMEEAALKSAFSPFWSGDHQNSGWGLGLSIVSKLLETMDGSLEADSDIGRGTTVRVRLPAAEVPTTAALNDDKAGISEPNKFALSA